MVIRLYFIVTNRVHLSYYRTPIDFQSRLANMVVD